MVYYSGVYYYQSPLYVHVLSKGIGFESKKKKKSSLETITSHYAKITRAPKIASHNCPFWAIVVTICATTRHSATRMNFQFAIYRRYNLI